MKSDVCIAGGGMGGMCAAIILSGAGKNVTILERQERIGRKLLLTGSGKCNISNVRMDSSHYLSDDPDKLRSLIEGFDGERAEKFLCELGINLCEKNGFLYPVTRQASTVLDALRFRLEENGVTIVTDACVSAVEKTDCGFSLKCEDGREFSADKCICACGGMAGVYGEDRSNGYAVMKEAGHKVIKPAPALVQLAPQDELKPIAGIRCDARVTLNIRGDEVASDLGELQITEKYFSGIPVFQLSRYLCFAKDAALKIDFLPFIKDDETVMERYAGFSERELERFFTGWLNKKLAVYLIKRAGLRPQARTSELGQETILDLVREFKNEIFELKATGGFKNAQVSNGGIPLSEVTGDCESIFMPGLYIIGEMLNVCGECGGYNLHFAMASAYAAAGRILCTE